MHPVGHSLACAKLYILFRTERITIPSPAAHLVYVIESAAYGLYSRVVCGQNPNERGASECRLLTLTASDYNPLQSIFYDESRLLQVARLALSGRGKCSHILQLAIFWDRAYFVYSPKTEVIQIGEYISSLSEALQFCCAAQLAYRTWIIAA